MDFKTNSGADPGGSNYYLKTLKETNLLTASNNLFLEYQLGLSIHG